MYGAVDAVTADEEVKAHTRRCGLPLHFPGLFEFFDMSMLIAARGHVSLDLPTPRVIRVPPLTLADPVWGLTRSVSGVLAIIRRTFPGGHCANVSGVTLIPRGVGSERGYFATIFTDHFNQLYV